MTMVARSLIRTRRKNLKWRNRRVRRTRRRLILNNKKVVVPAAARPRVEGVTTFPAAAVVVVVARPPCVFQNQRPRAEVVRGAANLLLFKQLPLPLPLLVVVQDQIQGGMHVVFICFFFLLVAVLSLTHAPPMVSLAPSFLFFLPFSQIQTCSTASYQSWCTRSILLQTFRFTTSQCHGCLRPSPWCS